MTPDEKSRAAELADVKAALTRLLVGHRLTFAESVAVLSAELASVVKSQRLQDAHAKLRAIPPIEDA